MGKRTIIFCDECGAEKGSTNGWFAVRNLPNGPLFLRAEDVGDAYQSYLALDLCGRQCAQTTLERWLETGSIEKQPQSPEPQDTLSGSSVKPEGANQ